MNNTQVELTKEYQAWCAKYGYPEMSADELFYETNEKGEFIATATDRMWLADFIERWEINQE